jgi:hypothetical protein
MLNPKASSCSHWPEARPKFAWKEPHSGVATGSVVRNRRYSKDERSKSDESVAESLFGGLGMNCFSNFLIEGVAFAFGGEPFVFGLNIGFAFP